MNAQAQPIEGEFIPAEVLKAPAALAAPNEARALLAIAESYVIDSPPMFQAAGAELQDIAAKRKALETMRLSITRPMDEAKSRIMDFFRAPTETLERAECLLRDGMGQYEAAERKRREDERRAAEAAARAEAERLERELREAEAKARAEREAAERAQRDAEEAQRKAAQAAQTERDAETRAAAQAEAERAAQAAQSAREAAAASQAAAETKAVEAELVEIAPPMPVAQVTKAAGVGFRSQWKAEVNDVPKMLAAVAGNPAWHGLLKVDEAALGQLARATKGALKIDGVRFYEDRIASVRSR